ncbi:MAG: butyrate kinase [bacterium]|nr:butyrate kinase [Candidatus Limimorpha caballi]MCQ2308562.1 butyrate kinase [Bacteroidales bacterium]MCQ2316842.1 butyrate kinase [Bacteroidales bacterium]
MYKLLIINPGSTSTKIAVFHDKEQVFKKNIKHSTEEVSKFEKIADQFEFRKDVIMSELKAEGIDLTGLTAVVGRGGLLHPLTSGVYEVNAAMIRDLNEAANGEHACNLGGLIANSIAKEFGVKAYIADPVVVDEMDDVARYSGHPLFPRKSIFHALNQKIIARTHAKAVNRKYEDLNLIGIHLGGGISVAAHKKGRVVDVNNALNGDGPFTPERSGVLPSGPLMNACFSGKYTKKDIDLMLKGQGGFVAYLGTNDALTVEKEVRAGNKEWEKVYRAMAYQIAKEVGGLAASAFSMDVDGIFVTGGMAYDKLFCSILNDHLHKIAPVFVYPGEDEMAALAMNGVMVLDGEVEAKMYE